MTLLDFPFSIKNVLSPLILCIFITYSLRLLDIAIYTLLKVAMHPCFLPMFTISHRQ